ncbi:MAG TPA: protein-disulfide reductase DsbD domain-containing protein [Vicinamibacterales bacterium]|nr:protein-disulfide reductase DsbD domain-containing protein [Vicinamibacterales bacterium]
MLARLGVRVEAVGAVQAAGRQITVVAGTSEADAPPGRRLTLIVDVTPAPRMHVYAPGQPGYIPIGMTLDETPDVRAGPSRFPAPGTYFFEPLNETVKVFAKPFRITQEVTLGLSRELRQRAAARETLTLTGRLDYQACDDTVCYRPDSIPLRWTIRLLPYQQ